MTGIKITSRELSRILLLDLIRILSISLVVIAHMLKVSINWDGSLFRVPGLENVITVGGVGVMFAIVLSGMVLEYNYGKIKVNIPKFYFKRLKRIYPVYWLC